MRAKKFIKLKGKKPDHCFDCGRPLRAKKGCKRCTRCSIKHRDLLKITERRIKRKWLKNKTG